MKRALLPIFVVAALLLPASLRAQSYSIDWFTIGGGGGTSTGGPYSISGTIGQPDAGTMSGGPYSVVGGFWSLVSVVQQPSAPTLFLTQSDIFAILSWTTNAVGFSLEKSANLALPNGWSTVATTPTVASGFNYVTNTVTAGNSFFRLHHP